MTEFLPIAGIVAVVGSGVVTGLLFAFSNFVLQALAELPSEHGMRAMQRINETIINPIFLTLFLGTPIACVLIIVFALANLGAAGHLPLMLGAVIYLIGPLGITVLRNVPLNNKLADAPLSDAETHWPEYRREWQFWNHIRSYLGIASIAILALGLVQL